MPTDEPTRLTDWADRVTREELLDALEEYGQVHLHAKDPSASTSAVEYNTAVHHWADGELIATAAADAKHNHYGIYTRANPVDSKRPGRLKRLNVQGGRDTTVVRTYGPREENQFVQSAMTNVRHVFKAGSGSLKVNWLLDADRGAFRLHDFDGEGDLLSFGVGKNWGDVGGLLGDRLSGLAKDIQDCVDRLTALGEQTRPDPGPAVEEIADPSPEDVPEQGLVWDSAGERLCYRPKGSEDVYWFSPSGTL